MMRLIGRRLLKLLPVLFLVSLATFLMVDLVPGDPAAAMLGADATVEQLEEVRRELGLDRPVHERYVDWLSSAVTGDLGPSLMRPGFTVMELLKQSLPITLQLALMSMIMALGMAIPLAITAAQHEDGLVDRIISALSASLISVPSFVAGLLLAYLFVFQPHVPQYGTLLVGGTIGVAMVVSAVTKRDDRSSRATTALAVGGVVVALVSVALFTRFPSFPRTGFVRITSEQGVWANLRSAFLPSLAIALSEVAVFTRLLRGDLITTMQEDFILSARAKGMGAGHVLWREALRPSAFSLVTIAGVAFGRTIGGTVIVESIFGIQGLGRLVVTDGVIPGDYAVVQGGVLLVAMFYVLINACVDISYSYIDPRIRRG